MEGRNYVDSMLVNVFQTIDPSLGTSLVPALTTTADNVDASYANNPVTGDATPFRVTFSGVLTADADGNYLFRLPAADGAVLTIDGQSVILQPSLPGDGNLTGNVNFADYQNLMSHYGMTSGATWAQGDFNGDGAVNFADYQILNDNYGQTVTARAIDDTNTTGFYLTAGRHSFQLSYYQFNNSGNPLAQLQWQTPGSSSFTTIDAAHFAKLSAPTGITAAHDFVTDAVDLSWTNPARATQTLVQRSDDGGATWHALATVPVTAGQATSAYADATVAALSRPQYRLIAEDGISRDGLGDDLDQGGVPSAPVAAGPAITTAASASPSAITDGGTTATLTVAAAEDGASASDLRYTWGVVSEPAGAADPDFANNGTTGAATTTATFHDAGTYVLSAQADDGLLTSDPADGAGQVTVQVYPRLASVAATTGGATVPTGGGSYQLGAVGLDQFGHALYNVPGVTWTVTGGTGSGATVSTGGLFTAPSAAAGTTYVLTAHATWNDSLLGGAAADVTVTITQSGTGATPTAAPDGVTDLIASPGQDGDATLAWSNPATGAAPDGFRVEASDDNGTTFTPIGTAAPGSTTFLATGLTGNAPYLFRVTPFNAAGSATATTTASAVTPGGYADTNWYKVTLNVPGNPTATTAAFTQGSSDTTTAPGGSLSITTATQANGGWVQADSAAQAVSKALAGTFVSGTDGASYPFATSGALRYDPDLVLANGTDVGPAVVAEEKFDQAGHGDADYNDAYVPVNVVQDAIWVHPAYDGTPYSIAANQTFVGTYGAADATASSTDFSATVRWAGVTLTGNISSFGNAFVVTVPTASVPTGDDARNYTLTVSHQPTGVVSTADAGSGAPPAATPAAGTGRTRRHHHHHTPATVPPSISTVRFTAGSRPGHDLSNYSKIDFLSATSNAAFPTRVTVTYNPGSPNLNKARYYLYWSTDAADLGNYEHVSATVGTPDPISKLPTLVANLSDLVGGNGSPFYSGPAYDPAHPSSDPAGTAADPAVYYFRVVVVNGASPPTTLQAGAYLQSSAVCPPQAFYSWGLNGNEQSNGREDQLTYDQAIQGEVHAFGWDRPADETASITSHLPAQAMPVILLGQSLGGGSAVSIANNFWGTGRSVGYVGLFDPVALYEGQTDAHLDHDPYPTFPTPVDPKNTVPVNDAHSNFYLYQDVLSADDWWQSYADEGGGNGMGYISNIISNPNAHDPAPDNPGRVTDPVTSASGIYRDHYGTGAGYHPSQTDDYDTVFNNHAPTTGVLSSKWVTVEAGVQKGVNLYSQKWVAATNA